MLIEIKNKEGRILRVSPDQLDGFRKDGFAPLDETPVQEDAPHPGQIAGDNAYKLALEQGKSPEVAGQIARNEAAKLNYGGYTIPVPAAKPEGSETAGSGSGKGN